MFVEAEATFGSITQINLFEILLNQTEIRLCLPFSSFDLEQQMDTVRLLERFFCECMTKVRALENTHVEKIFLNLVRSNQI